MGARGKKMSSFLLTKYSIKKFKRFVSVFIKYLLIRFLLLKMQLYNRYFGITLVNIGVIFCITLFPYYLLTCFLGSWVCSFCIDPVLLCAFIPIQIYFNAEADKAQILSENKNKAGIYL
jgi:hypothetical protein